MYTPIQIVPEEDFLVVKGKVESIYEEGEKDICFKLYGNDQFFLYQSWA